MRRLVACLASVDEDGDRMCIFGSRMMMRADVCGQKSIRYKVVDRRGRNVSMLSSHRMALESKPTRIFTFSQPWQEYEQLIGLNVSSRAS